MRVVSISANPAHDGDTKAAAFFSGIDGGDVAEGGGIASRHLRRPGHCIIGTRSRAARERRANMVAVMKTNVTLKLDADLLREARVLAAEEGRSISALLTDRLEAMVRERRAFDKARRRALARLREGLDLQWTPLKSRDELHER